MGLAGQLANRGSKYLFSAAIAGVPPNLCVSRSWRVRRVTTSALVLHDDKGKEELRHTIILSQNGPNIQELPVIVRKAKLTSALWDEPSNSETDKSPFPEHQADEDELTELNAVLKSCRTLKHLLELVLTVPDYELTAAVSVEILRKLIELENNQHYRRKTPPSNGLDDKEKNNLRDVVVCSLLEVIVPCEDPKLIVESLKIITRDMTRAASRNNNSWVGFYRARLSHEALILATDSKFTVTQLCEVVNAFSYIYKDDSELTDMLWVGFEARSGEINDTNIVEVFRVLPLFKKSRKVILAQAETAFLQVCWSLSGAAIAEVMGSLQVCKEVSV